MKCRLLQLAFSLALTFAIVISLARITGGPPNETPVSVARANY